MKEHPILFSTPMVQAILEGRKTQTRRVAKVTNPNVNEFLTFSTDPDATWPANYGFGALMVTPWGNLEAVKFPYGQVGDILWVRESFTVLEPEHVVGGMANRFVYKANVKEGSESDEIRQEYILHGWPYQWKPSIHMPREACRLRLKITDIRVERLQDISEADAMAEGVKFTDFGRDQWNMQHRGFHVLEVTGPEQCLATARTAFGNLWEKINGPASWDINPWVWAITFEKVTP